MGRRRRKKVQKKPERRIPTVFTCPNCGEDSVKVEINKNEGYAVVGCGNPECGLKKNVKIGKLTEPVDAYSEFVDAFYEEEKSE
ncbi:MAG: transcription elongation factor 1 family protein [Candidatus Jordarchaeaceae archaeon]